MRLFWQFLILVLVLGLIYVVAQGLGLTKGFSKKKETKRILVINDFEDPSMDLDWASGGYVKLETSTDNQTHGKRSAMATFMLQSQFYPTPTLGPNAPPTATPMPPTPTPNPKVKVVPTPTWLWTVMRPWWAAISRCTIARPTPVPSKSSPLCSLWKTPNSFSA